MALVNSISEQAALNCHLFTREIFAAVFPKRAQPSMLELELFCQCVTLWSYELFRVEIPQGFFDVIDRLYMHHFDEELYQKWNEWKLQRLEVYSEGFGGLLLEGVYDELSPAQLPFIRVEPAKRDSEVIRELAVEAFRQIQGPARDQGRPRYQLDHLINACVRAAEGHRRLMVEARIL